jgi:tetratricopeptide (TPR) repeat protein
MAVDYLAEAQRFLESGAAICNRAQAIEAMRLLAMYIADGSVGESVYQTICRNRAEAVELQDRIILETARSALIWFTKRTAQYDEALRELKSLAGEAKRAGIIDSHAAKMLNIQGCLLCVVGQYEPALAVHCASFELSKRLGNVRRERDAADNIVLCHGRLGNYIEQQFWAERALRLRPAPYDGWDELRTTYRCSLALAMQGKNSEAVQVFEESAKATDPSGRLWVTQAMGLMRADIHIISGIEADALRYARAALSESSLRPLTNHYLGMVARWHAVLASRNAGFEESAQILDELWVGVPSFDRLDSAEVVAARITLKESSGVGALGERRDLAELLSALPTAIEIQLRRFGVIN